MISVAEALEKIAKHTRDFGAETVDLLHAIGRVLAGDVRADRDFPPFDRVMMDGIAVSKRAFDEGQREFGIERLQPAGAPQTSLRDDTACIEIMTGAILPAGADLIIPYEACRIEGRLAVVRADYAVRERQFIHPRGADCVKGDLLIPKDIRVTPAMAGTMATVGLDKVPVRILPRVAVCASGNELVEVTETPELHQIRRSNSYMLAAALRAEGIEADTYYLPDDQALMKNTLGELLPRYDVLLFSGAVSRGRLDFLPGVLDQLGMQTVFHGVAQKPGKPLLFGTFENGAVVFGLPGNPASTLVCFQIFFKYWLDKCLNHNAIQYNARLSEDVWFLPALSYHLLVSVRAVDGILVATPGKQTNSGDMVALQEADAVLTLPPDKSEFKTGEAYPLIFLASSW